MRTGDIHNRFFIARRFDTSALEDDKPREAQLSGSVLTAYGWSTVLWASFIPLALAVAVLFSLLPKVRAGRG